MVKTMDLLFTSAHIIDPAAGVDAVRDIRIEHGLITAIGEDLSTGGLERVDLHGALVFPGFMDMHVHAREPGYEYKETIATCAAAAAAGGFTAVLTMPNTNPPADDASVIRTVIERGMEALGGAVDVYPAGTVTSGRKGTALAPLAELWDAGARAFTDDGAPVASGGILRLALEYTKMFEGVILQHCEDLTLSAGGLVHEGAVSTQLGLPGCPAIAEEACLARDLRIVEFTGGRYHAQHLSCAASVHMIKDAKLSGLHVTAEVTPHHLTLHDEVLRSFNPNTKVNPPLRSKDDMMALREGLRDGVIDVIATDHAPHSFDEKEVEFAAAPFGIVGLETAIGLVITEIVGTGYLPLQRLPEVFSYNPRRILGLPIVKIAEGEKANLTIVDPTIAWKVDPALFHSRSRNTPFAGRALVGKAVGIYNHGKVFLGPELR